MKNAALALALVFVSALVVLAKMSLPGRGLDPSWSYALADGFARGLRFGHDMTFTSGPLSFLWTRDYRPQTFWATEIFEGLLVSIWVLSFLAFRYLTLSVIVVALTGAVFPSIGVLDGVIYVTLLLMFGAAMVRGRWVAPLICFLFGFLFSMKFSFWLAAFPLAMILDVRALAVRRAFPMAIGLFIAGSLLSFVISGNDIHDIARYTHISLDIALGFADAMQVAGVTYFPALYAVVFGAWLCWAFVQDVCRESHGITRQRRIENGLFCLGVAWLGFVIWKAGFVRQDSHELTAFFCLPFLALGLLARPHGRRRYVAGAAVVVTTVLAGVAGQAIATSNFPFWKDQPASASLMNRFAALDDFVTPFASATRYATDYKSVVADIAQHAPADLHGSVASIPWNMAEIIAKGYDVRYQPVLQTYSAYTPYLQALTRDFFNLRGPDNLLVELNAIDGQLPTLLFGASLESIITHYDAVDDSPFALLATRRAEPRTVSEGQSVKTTTTFGTWVDVASLNSGYIRAAFDIEPDLVGRVMQVLWNINPPRLELKLEDDSTVDFRLVDGVARAGFLLSPFLQDTNDLIPPLTSGVAQAPKVKAFRILPPASGLPSYRNAIGVTLTPLTIEGDALNAANPNMMLKSEIGASDAVEGGVKPRWLDADTLFAHPPSDVQISIPPHSALTGQTGILEEAWVRGTTTGVDFSVKSDDGTLLYDTQMRPRQEAADRGDRSFTVRNDGNAPLHVHLSTSALGDVAWDWGYWRGLHFD